MKGVWPFSIHLFATYVFVEGHACLCTYVGVQVYSPVCRGRGKVSSGIFVYHSLFYFLRQGILLNPEPAL